MAERTVRTPLEIAERLIADAKNATEACVPDDDDEDPEPFDPLTGPMSPGDVARDTACLSTSASDAVAKMHATCDRVLSDQNASPLETAIATAFSRPEYDAVSRRWRACLGRQPADINNFDPSDIVLFEGDENTVHDDTHGLYVRHLPYLLILARQAMRVIEDRARKEPVSVAEHELCLCLKYHIRRVED